MNDTILLALRAVGLTVGLVVGGILMRHIPMWMVILIGIGIMVAVSLSYEFIKTRTEKNAE